MQSVRADAPWCPSNIEFIRRINGLDSHRRRAAHRLRRQLSGARPGRRLPRRAGRDAARSAPPAGDHQVQPGAHLDAGERRRHRRRLPVRLRHGRPGRLPVRRPHRADVEPLPRRPRDFRAGKPWLLRFFDQIRFYPGQRRRAAADARATFRTAAIRCDIEEQQLRARATTTRFLRDNARDPSTAFQATAAGGLRGRARTLARSRRSTEIAARRNTAPAAAAAAICPTDATAVARRSPAASGRSRVRAGRSASQAGRRTGGPRSHEDGDRASRADAGGIGARAALRARPRRCNARRCAGCHRHGADDMNAT